ncbi:MAG: hypothetical protein VXZ84_03205 [Planctomycetota bacterium]|nr:hypothetical protein [Planctomycetota bacterium]
MRANLSIEQDEVEVVKRILCQSVYCTPWYRAENQLKKIGAVTACMQPLRRSGFLNAMAENKFSAIALIDVVDHIKGRRE